MVRFIFTLAFLFSIIITDAQTFSASITQADEPWRFVPFHVGNSWGYSDIKGQLVIPPLGNINGMEVSDVSPFSNNIALITLVEPNGDIYSSPSYGLVDPKLNLITYSSLLFVDMVTSN